MQSNLLGTTMNTCRYSLNFDIPKTKKGVEGLRQYLADIFQEMTIYCEKIALLPWDSETLDNAIKEADNIPSRINDLKKYFQNAQSYENGGYVYSKIRLGFPIDQLSERSNFESNMRAWLQNRSIRMYECAVQHSRVCTCG